MVEKVGGIEVEIGGDNSKLDGALEESKGKLKRFADEARNSINTIGKIGAASAVAGSAILTHLVVSSARAAKEIRNMANVAGTTPKIFQQQAFAARQVGIESDKYADILKDVQDRVGEFMNTGGGPMLDFFEQIAPKAGVTAKQFQGLGGPEALQLYVSSLEKANVSQAEMTFYLEALAGDASRLAPLLRNNGAKMQNLTNNADDLGIALSGVEIERLAQLDRSIDAATSSFDAMTKHLAASVAPTVDAVITLMTEATKEAGGVGEVGSQAGNKITDAMLFAADSVAGLKRVFQVVGRALAVGFLKIEQSALLAAKAIINGPALALGKLIEASNEFLGTDFKNPLTGLSQSINKDLQEVSRAIEFGKQDIENILMEPLPSDVLQPMIEESKKKMSEAAAEARRTLERVLSGGTKTKSGKTECQEKTGWKEQFDALRARYDERFAIELEFRNRLAELDKTYKEAEIKDEQLHSELRKKIEKEKQERLTELAQRGEEKRAQFAMQAADTIGNALIGLTRLTGSEGKKAFELNKKIGTGKALVSMYTGANKALELGWPLGPIAAASVIANGLANVAQINAQTFSGGGTGAPSSASASSGMANVQSSAQQQEPSQPSRTANINVTGSNFSRDAVIQMAGEMKKLSKEGFEFNV